jgi:hypothetical protein
VLKRKFNLISRAWNLINCCVLLYPLLGYNSPKFAAPVVHAVAHARMWELDLSHFLKPLRYQKVASIGDDAFDDMTSNSSPPGLPLVNGQKSVKRKSAMYALCHLFYHACALFSLSPSYSLSITTIYRMIRACGSCQLQVCLSTCSHAPHS